jgi:hypothetical protein
MAHNATYAPPANFIDPLGLQKDCTFANGCKQPHFNDAVSSIFGCTFGLGISCARVSAELLESEAAYVSRVTEDFLGLCINSGHCNANTPYTVDRVTYRWVDTAHTTSLDDQGNSVFGVTTAHWEISGPGPVDYTQFSVSSMGFNLTFSVDKNTHFYVSPGFSVGASTPSPVTVSLTSGWITTQNRNTRDFLIGPGCSYGWQYLFVGETHDVSSGGKGTSVPYASNPQVGLTCGCGFHLF